MGLLKKRNFRHKMHISLNWLKDYIQTDLAPEKLGEVLTEIGLEVEGMEMKESVKGGLEGLVIGHVVECAKHPNADKLSLTKVDVGGEEPIQIVCGAPNVAAGQKVVVATVGTTLYDKDGAPWKIKKGKIRGEESQGMICAEDEIGLGTSHDGIMVLPADAPVGKRANEHFEIEQDYIYDIGLTPNRSDATCHIGVARDLAAALKINYEGSGDLNLPDLSSFSIDNTTQKIEVLVEDKIACPRYSGLILTDIKDMTSPDWLRNKLQAIGVKSINAVVDITNFVLHEYGQPLHAFDLDKIKGKKIIVQKLVADTSFQSLDDKTLKLHEDDLVICDGDGQPMCLAGVYGGLDSGVTSSTTSIFLESAQFHPITIRKTSTRHQLRTDAAKVFEKGSDPNKTIDALKRASMLMQSIIGAKVSSEIVDVYPTPIKPEVVEVTKTVVDKMMGIEIPEKELLRIFDALNMKCAIKSTGIYNVSIPTDKFDVLREVDVIEEIIRIYGLNKIPIPTKINAAISSDKPLQPLKMKSHLSDIMIGMGYHEMMAVSLSKSTYYDKVLPRDASTLVYVNNTSNRDSDIMRPDMLISGLEAIAHNQNRQNSDLKLYEFGKIYHNEDKGIKEQSCLSVMLTGQLQNESWINGDKNMVTYFDLKSTVKMLLERLAIEGFQIGRIEDDMFTYGQRYFRGPNPLVTMGKVKASINKHFGIKNEVFFATLNLDSIYKSTAKQKVVFKGINKFPGTRRDLALVIDEGVEFIKIQSIAKKVEKKHLKEVNLFDIYRNEEQIGKGKKSYSVSFEFENPEKTIKDKDVDKVMNALISQYEKELSATIRR